MSNPKDFYIELGRVPAGTVVENYGNGPVFCMPDGSSKWFDIDTSVYPPRIVETILTADVIDDFEITVTSTETVRTA